MHYISAPTALLVLPLAGKCKTLLLFFNEGVPNEHLKKFINDPKIIKIGSNLERAAGILNEFYEFEMNTFDVEDFLAVYIPGSLEGCYKRSPRSEPSNA